jgi:hypothetical protein
MRNLTLKSTGQGYGYTLGRPHADPGPQPSGAILIRVADVPDDVPAIDVLRQANRTVVRNRDGGTMLDAHDWTVPWAAIAGLPQGGIARLA